jgi:hypothetical protein
LCVIDNIFPAPQVKILWVKSNHNWWVSKKKILNYFFRFNDKEQENVTVTNNKVEDENLYDVEAKLNVKKSDIEDESEVTCLVNIPNSDYTKRETITYDGMKSF